MLLELFSKDLLQLPRVAQSLDERAPPVTFEASKFPSLPAEMQAPGISIEKRQVYRGSGLMDSVRIVLDRAHSTALGLWILAAALQRRHASYCLHLPSNGASLRKIIWQAESRSGPGVNIREASFVWVPGALSADLSAGMQHLYLSQTAQITIVDDNGDWDAPLNTRDNLQGRGGTGAACMLAAFLLDFGLSSNALNYDYIKDYGQSQLVDRHSCEARVELSDAWSQGLMMRKATTH